MLGVDGRDCACTLDANTHALRTRTALLIVRPLRQPRLYTATTPKAELGYGSKDRKDGGSV
jgi:hypothetical protein